MAFQITGITRDNVGNIAGSCDVYLLKYTSGTHLFTQIARVVSDASTGVFLFSGIADNDPAYNIVAFKDGSPDIFDVSDRNIIPQFVSAGTAWNVSDKSAEVTLSNNNLTMAVTTVGGGVRSNTSHASGKFYVEFTLDAATHGLSSFTGLIGFARSDASLNAANALDNPSNSVGMRIQSCVEWDNTGDGFATPALAIGETLGYALDINNQKCWYISNGAGWGAGLWQNAEPASNSVDIGTNYQFGTPAQPLYIFAMGLANSNTMQVTIRADGTSGVGITVPAGYGNAW